MRPASSLKISPQSPYLPAGPAGPHALCPLQEGKLAASEELGDLFKAASDWDTALAIYQQAGASGKVVEALAAKGDFEQLVRAGLAAAGWGCTPGQCAIMGGPDVGCHQGLLACIGLACWQ